MKKVLLLATVALSCMQSSFAQHFKNGFGAGISVEDAQYMDTKVNFTFTYSPALFFAEQENTSFSVGIPISFGVNGGYSSDAYDGYYYNSTSSIGFMLDIPVILNFNYGAGAVKGGHKKWGFFAGAGYGYHLSTDEYSNYYDDNGNYKTSDNSTLGVTGNAGFRIGMGHRRRHNLEIKFTYMKGLTSYRPNVYGVNCIFNL
ncbi:hypothetical protein SIO70_24650 [Chitinophaga sancti]|uniref:hypothetical protein n=1 Tax=Chitinophaga sancti TaxID=1004 RepID=UPI002A75EEC1|nr:hypothetical protein [Chitinophaga sancti]WPQ61554.1 hypothetical protein SIO70_24650 [Chitinophaga sancti]